MVELADQGSADNVVHRKRRRKNVESRDAWTQTERSDYMLIKQRQLAKQKQLLSIIQQKNDQDAAQQNVVASTLLAEADLIPNRLVEDYLQQQHGGLVQQLIGEYHNQAPLQQEKTREGARISKLAHFVENRGHLLTRDQVNRLSKSVVNSSSPSKKHRHLVESRQGTTFPGSQPDTGTREVADNTRVNTGHAARRKKYNQTTHGAQPSEPGPLFQEGTSPAQLSQQQLTNWQKISVNNHELTKLFYQLPAGTKNLVQHAILSQNKQLHTQQQLVKSQGGASKTFQARPKKLAAAESHLASAKGMSSSKAELINQSDYFPMLSHPQGRTAVPSKPMTASKHGRVMKNRTVQKQLTFDQSAALPGSSKSIPKKLMYHQNSLGAQETRLTHTTKKPPRSGFIPAKPELRTQYTNSKRTTVKPADEAADNLHVTKFNLIQSKAPKESQDSSNRESIKFSKQSSAAQIKVVTSKEDKGLPKQPSIQPQAKSAFAEQTNQTAMKERIQVPRMISFSNVFLDQALAASHNKNF